MQIWRSSRSFWDLEITSSWIPAPFYHLMLRLKMKFSTPLYSPLEMILFSVGLQHCKFFSIPRVPSHSSLPLSVSPSLPAARPSLRDAIFRCPGLLQSLSHELINVNLPQPLLFKGCYSEVIRSFPQWIAYPDTHWLSPSAVLIIVVKHTELKVTILKGMIQWH